MHYSWGAPVGKNFFLLQSVMKRNPFRTFMRKNKNFAFFRFEFLASYHSKINRVYFALFHFQKLFVSLRFTSFSFYFRFISFSFPFRWENKRKKPFRHQSEKYFASVLLHFASKRKLRQFFASVSLNFTSKQK